MLLQVATEVAATAEVAVAMVAANKVVTEEAKATEEVVVRLPHASEKTLTDICRLRRRRRRR